MKSIPSPLNILSNSLRRKRSILSARKSSIMLLIAKITQILVSVVSVPLLLGYLGRDGYGLVLTVGSVLNWIMLSDMGIENGVKNRLIDAFSKNNHVAAKNFVATGIFGLAFLSVLLTLIFITIWSIVPWYAVFNAPSIPVHVIDKLVLIVGVLVIVRLPLGCVRAILSARQKEYVISSFEIFGAVLGLCLIYIATVLDWGLVNLVASRNLMGLLAMVTCGYFIFRNDERSLLPRIGSVSLLYWKKIWVLGSSFFAIQVSMIILYQTDLFLINYFMGSEYVVDYFLHSQLFLYMNFIIILMFRPLWPAIGEARSNNDLAWINRIVANVRLAVIVLTLGGALILFFIAPQLIKFWSKGDVIAIIPLLLALCIYSAINNWIKIHSIVLNGMNLIKIQSRVFAIEALMNIVFSSILIISIGLVGAVYGSILAALLSSAWVIPIMTRRSVANN